MTWVYHSKIVIRLIAVVVVSGQLLTGIPAVSATRADDDVMSSSGPDPTSGIQTQLKMFDKVSLTAKEAIAIAEDQLGEASVIDIGFDVDGGVPVFRLKIDRASKFWNAVVDATTRKLREVSPSDASRSERSTVRRFKRLRMGLSEAIGIAEMYGTGKAVSATLDNADGRIVFLIVVASDGRLKRVSIDPKKDAERRILGIDR